MISYFDSSALVKRYVAERGSEEVAQLIQSSEMVGTVLLSRAEVVAALAKATRVGALSEDAATEARDRFESEWRDWVRLAVPEALAARAGDLAWSHALRGYDALHLSAARTWADLMDEPVTFATFDRSLWTAADREGLTAWPEDLPALLESWTEADSPPPHPA